MVGPALPTSPLLHLQAFLSLPQASGMMRSPLPQDLGRKWLGMGQTFLLFSFAHSSNLIFIFIYFSPSPCVAGFSSLSLGFHSYKLEITITSLLNARHHKHSPLTMHKDSEQNGSHGTGRGEAALICASVSVSEKPGCWVPGPRSHNGAKCGSFSAQHEVLVFVSHLPVCLAEPRTLLPLLRLATSPRTSAHRLSTHLHACTHKRTYCSKASPSSGFVFSSLCPEPQGSSSPS